MVQRLVASTSRAGWSFVYASVFRAAVRRPDARSFRFKDGPFRSHGCLEKGARWLEFTPARGRDARVRGEWYGPGSHAGAGRLKVSGRNGEVVPEMRSAVSRARKVLEVASSVEDIDRDVGNTGDDTLGLQKGDGRRG